MSKPDAKEKVFQKSNESLQVQLHTLLTRLSDSSEIINKWPEDGDDNSIHAETTTKLITSIQKVVSAIKLVEERVNPNIGDDEKSKPSEQETNLANQLRQTAVPLDLLDMMDANSESGLNPDCFARGLLSEALRQFVNLKTRKASMNMLAQMVETGFDQREREREQKKKAAAMEKLKLTKEEETVGATTSGSKVTTKDDGSNGSNEELLSKKRKREPDADTDADTKVDEDNNSDGVEEPPTKK